MGALDNTCAVPVRMRCGVGHALDIHLDPLPIATNKPTTALVVIMLGSAHELNLAKPAQIVLE